MPNKLAAIAIILLPLFFSSSCLTPYSEDDIVSKLNSIVFSKDTSAGSTNSAVTEEYVVILDNLWPQQSEALESIILDYLIYYPNKVIFYYFTPRNKLSLPLNVKVFHDAFMISQVESLLGGNNIVHIVDDKILFSDFFLEDYPNKIVIDLHFSLERIDNFRIVKEGNKLEKYIDTKLLFDLCFSESPPDSKKNYAVLLVANPNYSKNNKSICEYFCSAAYNHSYSGKILFTPPLLPNDVLHISKNFSILLPTEYCNNAIIDQLQLLQKVNLGIPSNILLIYKGNQLAESVYIDDKCSLIEEYLGY
jgi:hypothetical protein